MSGRAAIRHRIVSVALCIGVIGVVLLPRSGFAEPYLAVQAGLKCGQCHVNPSGGGKRTLFGMIYARTQVAVRQVLSQEGAAGWNSQVNDWFGIGGDLRLGYTDDRVPRQADDSDFDISRGTVYAEFRAVPQLLTFYFDQQVAPDDTFNREAYALITPLDGKLTIKAGQFFLPFGLRLQDDSAFVRQRSGINFATPDDGIELGVELPKWSAQLAVTNGTAGEGSAPGKDQYSLSAAYVLPKWRVGVSANFNQDPLGDREMLGLFAGLRTGPISWLAEIDLIEDKTPGSASTDIYASLIEGNWLLRRGHNLKFSYEFVDPSNRQREDELERYSIVWEYAPLQLFQTRVGWRAYNGVPQFPLTNRDSFFVEAHVYF